LKTYRQYYPIAKASEPLGERWSVLVLRELLIGSHKFNDSVRGLPEMPRTLLTKRLRQFEEVELLERVDG
jgi:DNA-binding HxlR family transcriptional regulator